MSRSNLNHTCESSIEMVLAIEISKKPFALGRRFTYFSEKCVHIVQTTCKEMVCFLTEKANGITYDPGRDQFILACDYGKLFGLPTCPKCNEYIKITEHDLHALSYADYWLFIVDDGFSGFIQR